MASNMCNGEICNNTTTIENMAERMMEADAETTTTNMVWYLCNPSMLLLFLVPLSLLLDKKTKQDPQKAATQKDGKRLMKMMSLLLMLSMILIHFLIQERSLDNVKTDFNIASCFNLFIGWPGSYILMTSLVICEILKVTNVDFTLVRTIFWFMTFSNSTVKLCCSQPDIATQESIDYEGYLNLIIAAVNLCICIYDVISDIQQKGTKDHETTEKTKWTCKSILGNCFSNLMFYWVRDVMMTGYRRDLTIEDLPEIRQCDKSSDAFARFDRNWKIARATNEINAGEPSEDQEMDQKQLLDESEEPTKKQVKGVSLFKILVKSFGLKFFTMQFMLGGFKLCTNIEPYLTKQFMIFIQNREDEHWISGARIVFSLFLFNLFRVIYNHRLHFEIANHQTYIASSIKMAIFKKSLKVKNVCNKDKTTADVVNLMSAECDRIEGMSRNFHILVSEPLMICISMIMLYIEVGNATFAGVAILLVFIPFNHFIGKKLTNLGIQSRELEDKRTAAMNEIVNGIKALKLYAWEPYFISKVNEIRKECEDCNAKKSLMDALLDVIFRAIPFIVKSVAFATFLLLGGHLDAVTAFTSFHLFHMLNHPFSIMALFLPGFVEMAESMKKINEYLNHEDIPENITERKSNKGKYSIVIKDGQFSWDRKAEGVTETTLKNLNITVPRGKLVAIVGKVGSGKSSLLSAVLGEMEKLDGNVQINGTIAYVPQEAWVMNKTLKENILFGSEMDTDHYKRVINASALIKDIKNMPAGDRSEIGEKGINLSGGQKQRVSMARALYKNADIYLFDDPLSAVDAHVGRHMFSKAIGRKSLIKNKTRILVTHGIHWLPHVDHILYIKDGTICESGTYEDLTSHHGEFTQFVQHALIESSEPMSPKVQKTRQNILKRIESIPDDPRVRMDQGFFSDQGNNGESSTDTSSSEAEEFKLTSDDKDTKVGTFLEDEEIEKGQIGFKIYLKYAQAVGYLSLALFMVVYGFQTIADFASTRILKEWTEDDFLNNHSDDKNKEIYDDTNWEYYRWFVLTGGSEVLLSFIFIAIILISSYRAATRLHNTLLNRILRCPMSFFDTTSTAKIVGLFSKDMGKIDGLGHCLRWFIAHILEMFNYLLMILIYCPMLVVCILPFVVIQYIIFKIHSSPARQLRRYRSKYRSPVYSHFTETLNGKDSIRAYGCQKHFSKTMEEKMDIVNNIDYWEKSVGWAAGMTSMLALRTLQFSISMFCIWCSSMTPGMVGLITMYATIFCVVVRGFFGLIVHMETEMVALERVVNYSDREMEAPWEILEKDTDTNWPTDGRVNFDNYKTRYAEGSDLVLKGIDCCIEPGQKVGIVGRTGAGKTSLANSIFRLLEASEGKINICGETIANLGLHELRSKINILPQDPIIFKGSLKMNLDPAGTKTDDELWTALKHANLYSFVEESEGKLDFECGEGGKNLSVGQKQLLCLARTLLRNSPILVLDEATAAVDMKTDATIQSTIRTAFKDCTVLTIAHRLNTVLDYDRIMVLDHGRVAEFDSPKNLLADKNTIFYSMVNDAEHAE